MNTVEWRENNQLLESVVEDIIQENELIDIKPDIMQFFMRQIESHAQQRLHIRDKSDFNRHIIVDLHQYIRHLRQKQVERSVKSTVQPVPQYHHTKSDYRQQMDVDYQKARNNMELYAQKRRPGDIDFSDKVEEPAPTSKNMDDLLEKEMLNRQYDTISLSTEDKKKVEEWIGKEEKTAPPSAHLQQVQALHQERPRNIPQPPSMFQSQEEPKQTIKIANEPLQYTPDIQNMVPRQEKRVTFSIEEEVSKSPESSRRRVDGFLERLQQKQREKNKMVQEENAQRRDDTSIIQSKTPIHQPQPQSSIIQPQTQNVQKREITSLQSKNVRCSLTQQLLEHTVTYQSTLNQHEIVYVEYVRGEKRERSRAFLEKSGKLVTMHLEHPFTRDNVPDEDTQTKTQETSQHNSTYNIYADPDYNTQLYTTEQTNNLILMSSFSISPPGDQEEEIVNDETHYLLHVGSSPILTHGVPDLLHKYPRIALQTQYRTEHEPTHIQYFSLQMKGSLSDANYFLIPKDDEHITYEDETRKPQFSYTSNEFTIW